MKTLLLPSTLTPQQLILFMVFLAGTLLFNQSAYAKKRCKPLKEKIYIIQAKQRVGHSAKKSIALDNQLAKARKKWWQCENSSNYHVKHKTKKKKSSHKPQ